MGENPWAQREDSNGFGEENESGENGESKDRAPGNAPGDFFGESVGWAPVLGSKEVIDPKPA